MVTFGPYTSYAYTYDLGPGSCSYPAFRGIQLYQDDILNQAVSAINASSLNSTLKNAAINIVNTIATSANNIPVSNIVSPFTATQSNVTGIATVTGPEAITPPASYCNTYEVTFTITVDINPTVSFVNLPTTVNTGESYTVRVDGYSPTGSLTSIVIQQSTNGGGSWTQLLSSGFAPTGSRTVTINNSNISTGSNTTILLRVISYDSAGNDSGYVQRTVNVNATPTVSYTQSPPSTVAQNAFHYIEALGNDIDTLTWGYRSEERRVGKECRL